MYYNSFILKSSFSNESFLLLEVILLLYRFYLSIYGFKQLDYWQIAENRLNFFIEYAQANHFDPLISSYWYRVTKRDISDFRVHIFFVFFRFS